MNALAVVPFCLSLFFLRDCFLLRMGPARLLSIRLRRYTVVFLATVLLVSGAMRRLGDEPLQLARASRLILVIAGFYALLAAICLWIRRTDRHHLAWILAAAPNPILAFSIALLARTMFPSASVYAVMAGSGFLAFVWIGLIVLWLRRTTQARMDVPDLDFSIGFASFVNSIALLLLPADFLLEKWGSG